MPSARPTPHSASTAVFAKLDVTFGDDVEGIGGKAGMRVSW
jgi:autotransporter family porin